MKGALSAKIRRLVLKAWFKNLVLRAWFQELGFKNLVKTSY